MKSIQDLPADLFPDGKTDDRDIKYFLLHECME